MKRVVLLSFFLMLGVLSSFAAQPETVQNVKQEGQVKDLVVVFSRSGHTEAIAAVLADELKADMIKLEDAEKVSAFKCYILGASAARKGKAWPIKPVDVKLSSYNRIFVGAPIWWGRTAPEMNAFVEQNDFTGKEVIVFVSLGGNESAAGIKMLSEKIEAKGGKVVSSFAVKTGGVKKEALLEKSKEIAQQYK